MEVSRWTPGWQAQQPGNRQNLKPLTFLTADWPVAVTTCSVRKSGALQEAANRGQSAGLRLR